MTTPTATMARSHFRAVSWFMPASAAMVGMLGKQSSVTVSMCHSRTCMMDFTSMQVREFTMASRMRAFTGTSLGSVAGAITPP